MKHVLVSALGLAICVGCSPKETVTDAAQETVSTQQDQRKAPAAYETIGSLELASNDLITRDAKIEKLGGAYQWSEGPVWIKDGGYLLFTDVPGNTIYKLSLIHI